MAMTNSKGSHQVEVMSHFRAVLRSLLFASMIFACSGKTLDVGSASQAGVGGDSDAEAADAGALEGDVPPPGGLTVDDTPCVITQQGGGGAEWPAWSHPLQADCGLLGHVRVVAESNASVPYPQSCSVVTSVYLGMDAEGDAGTLSYEARLGRGSCQFDSGPTLADPSTGIAFVATTVHASDRARSHRISYRAANAP